MRCVRYDWATRAVASARRQALGIFTALMGRFQALDAVRLPTLPVPLLMAEIGA